MRKSLSLLGILFLSLATKAQVAASPTFSPAAGTYTSAVSVTVSTVTAGANVYCTTDGTAPSLLSPIITSPISISVTTPLNCMAALPVVVQNNVQNANPASPGTFWKEAVCATPPAWASTTAYAIGAFVSTGGQNYQAIAAGTNHPPATSPTFWNRLNCGADDPGGTGFATNLVHTSGNASPSLSGASMKFSQTSQASKQTNVLWAVNGTFGGNNNATHFLADFYLQPDPSTGVNISAYETDTNYLFNTANGIRYMYGMQYCVVGGGCPGGVTGLDIGGNSNVPWTCTGISSPKPTVGQWLHYQVLTHRVPAEDTTKPCTSAGNWPYLYWDHIILNGIDFHTGNNGTNGWRFCANANPFGLVTGFQFQIDIASHASATTGGYFIDNANYIATTDYSSTTAGTYTISAPPTGGPSELFGNRTNFGGVIAHFINYIKKRL